MGVGAANRGAGAGVGRTEQACATGLRDPETDARTALRSCLHCPGRERPRCAAAGHAEPGAAASGGSIQGTGEPPRRAPRQPGSRACLSGWSSGSTGSAQRAQSGGAGGRGGLRTWGGKARPAVSTDEPLPAARHEPTGRNSPAAALPACQAPAPWRPLPKLPGSCPLIKQRERTLDARSQVMGWSIEAIRSGVSWPRSQATRLRRGTTAGQAGRPVAAEPGRGWPSAGRGQRAGRQEGRPGRGGAVGRQQHARSPPQPPHPTNAFIPPTPHPPPHTHTRTRPCCRSAGRPGRPRRW